MIRIANANMVNALKLVSVNRGFDPRDFTLIAFGGGGGMHAAALARELGIARVVVPVNAAVLLRLGHADDRPAARSRCRTRAVRVEPAAAGAIAATYGELADEPWTALFAADDATSRAVFRSCATPTCAIVGQEHW